MAKDIYADLKDVDILKIIKDPNTTSKKKNDCMTTLYNRYEKQIWKNWWRLQSEMHNSPMIVNMKDEYFLMAQEAFCVAISKIDMSRVENDKFKCVGMINWYLLNVKSKIRKELVEITSRTKSTSDLMRIDKDDNLSVDPDVEQSYWNAEGYKNDPLYVAENADKTNICNKILDNGLPSWTDYEKRIFNMIKIGYTNEKISIIENKSRQEIGLCVRKLKRDVKKAVGF